MKAEGIVASPILRLALGLLAFGVLDPARAGTDPTALWMGGKPVGSACLKQLEEGDLAFLAGVPRPNVPVTVSSRLFRGLESGNEEALAVGLRLVPLLDGETEQAVLKGLGDAMDGHPRSFLRSLQVFLDFARKNGRAAGLKETLWDAFMGADFGYTGDLGRETRDLRRRKALLEGLTEPASQEAQSFLLQMLREKIRQFPDGA